MKRKKLLLGLFLALMVLFVFTPLGSRVKSKLAGWVYGAEAVLKTQMQTPLDTYSWKLEDRHGAAFDFEEQRGSVVFINFWASWCRSCAKEMPSLKELYAAYGDKVVFLFVAQDDSDRVLPFLEKKGYNDLPVYFSKSAKPTALTSKVLPTTYIVDRKGRIGLARTGGMDWNGQSMKTLLEDLIKE